MMQAGFWMLVTASLCFGAGGRDQASSRTATKLTPEIAREIISTATKEGLDPFLVLEVMRRESAFNPRARNHKGAGGLMQLIPATARRFGITDPYDPQQAIAGGCKYLKYLMGLFPGRLDLVLAAYNAGEGAVARYNKSVPPYRETQNYVASITYGYRRAKWLEQNALKTRSTPRPLTDSEIRDRLSSLEAPALGSSTMREPEL